MPGLNVGQEPAEPHLGCTRAGEILFGESGNKNVLALGELGSGSAASAGSAPIPSAADIYKEAVKLGITLLASQGFVQCGVADAGIPGFATVDAQNN